MAESMPPAANSSGPLGSGEPAEADAAYLEPEAPAATGFPSEAPQQPVSGQQTVSGRPVSGRPVSGEQPVSEPAPVSQQPPVPQHAPVTRTAAVWVAVAVGLAVLVLLIIFILQNQDQVLVRFLGMQGSLALGVALLIAAVGGGILVALAGGARIIQLRIAGHRLRKRSRT